MRYPLSLLLFGKLEWPHLRGPSRMVLPERMPLPGGGHENPPQMGMPVEADAEHVPHFTFVPVGRRPQINYAGKRKVVFPKRRLDPYVFIPVIGEEMVDNGKIALGLALAVGTDPLVDRSEVIEHPVWRGDLRLQKAEDRKGLLARRPYRRYIVLRRLRDDVLITEPALDVLEYGVAFVHPCPQISHLVRRGKVGEAFSQVSLLVPERGLSPLSTTWDPAIQLSGLFSLPTAFRRRRSPSRNASGRGGHPGT